MKKLFPINFSDYNKRHILYHLPIFHTMNISSSLFNSHKVQFGGLYSTIRY